MLSDFRLQQIIFWLGLLCLLPGALAQQPPSPPQPSIPVLRSTTHLVQVNVIALDKNHQPVSNLAAADFYLSDDGRTQRISVFSVEKNEATTSNSRALPPNTFSNRWQDRAEAPSSVTVLLLDAINTRFEDQAYACQQALKFVEQIHPPDLIAIYAAGKDLRLLHDFSSDAKALGAALQSYKGAVPSELDASLDSQSGAQAVQASLPGRLGGGSVAGGSAASASVSTRRARAASESDFRVLRRSTTTVGAIIAIANYLARLPGRKNLIWVSGGFPFYLGSESLTRPGTMPRDSGAIRELLESAARALNNANLAIYPVDARGLMTQSLFDVRERAASRGSWESVPGLTPGTSEIQAMRDIADRTGGRAYYNTNGLTEAMHQALEDARVTYVLGYYPTHSKWDGKFHAIKLSVTRPGVELRYRRGYFAVPDEVLASGESQARLQAAVWSPLEATRLGFSVRVAPHSAAAGSKPAQLDLESELDARELTFRPQGDRMVGQVDLLIAELSGGGHNLGAIVQTVNLSLKSAT